MLYLDTSLLVAALTREPSTDRAQDWLAEQNPDVLAISEWVVTEFSAALSIKVRMNQLEPAHRAGALGLFAQLSAETFQTLSIEPQDFRTAARFADQAGLGLRAGDSLHLAIASRHGAEICTFDRKLAASGPDVGVATRLL